MELYSGKWQGYYSSQSEADLAFANLISDETQNADQFRRIFYASGLGKRKKAYRADYLEGLRIKSLDRAIPLIDFEGFKEAIEEKINNRPVAQLVEPIPHKNLGTGSNPVGPTITPPPGLLGELAKFIYQASAIQIPEVSLAAAIGFMSGVCGRSYNFQGTGLNLYTIIVAGTGCGKESAKSGIDKIVDVLRPSYSFIDDIIVGEHQSPNALLRELNSKPCVLSVLGEFALKMKNMCSARAHDIDNKKLAIFLELFNKSGSAQTFGSVKYADTGKNIPLTHSPSFSILAETTPDLFNKIISDEKVITSGFLPRFLMFKYKGMVPYINKNHHHVKPDSALIGKLSVLMQTIKKNIFIVPSEHYLINATIEAEKVLDDFSHYATDQRNLAETETGKYKEVLHQLWTRASIKVNRLSALVAVGVNPEHPIVLPEYVNWSINIILNDIQLLISDFESGKITDTSSDEALQIRELKSFIVDYYKNGMPTKPTYNKFKPYYNARIIPHSYMLLRMQRRGVFMNDNRKVLRAIKDTIDLLLNDGTLAKVSKEFFDNNKLNYINCYMITDLDQLNS